MLSLASHKKTVCVWNLWNEVGNSFHKSPVAQASINQIPGLLCLFTFILNAGVQMYSTMLGFSEVFLNVFIFIYVSLFMFGCLWTVEEGVSSPGTGVSCLC